jgi:hypothetical protein
MRARRSAIWGRARVGGVGAVGMCKCAKSKILNFWFAHLQNTLLARAPLTPRAAPHHRHSKHVLTHRRATPRKMVVYNFKTIQPVPGAKDFVDIVLTRTQRKTPTIVHAGWAISRIRSFYMRKLRFTQQTFQERFTLIVDEFPKLDVSPTFSTFAPPHRPQNAPRASTTPRFRKPTYYTRGSGSGGRRRAFYLPPIACTSQTTPSPILGKYVRLSHISTRATPPRRPYLTRHCDVYV